MDESERRNLNPRHLPWQGSALPLSYSREWKGSAFSRNMREKGLEPLHLTALDPKSSVSANFTTLASVTDYTKKGNLVNYTSHTSEIRRSNGPADSHHCPIPTSFSRQTASILLCIQLVEVLCQYETTVNSAVLDGGRLRRCRFGQYFHEGRGCLRLCLRLCDHQDRRHLIINWV